MGLFSFFKKSDKLGQENTIDSKDLLENIKVENTDDDRDVETKLSFHPDWDVPQEQKYIFNFLANELEPLKPNQLSLSSISIDPDPRTGKWLVRAFFRSSLAEEIELGEIELFIMDKNDELVATKDSTLRHWVQSLLKVLAHGYLNLKNQQLKSMKYLKKAGN